jgi:hypothetical protein
LQNGLLRNDRSSFNSMWSVCTLWRALRSRLIDQPVHVNTVRDEELVEFAARRGLVVVSGSSSTHRQPRCTVIDLSERAA